MTGDAEARADDAHLVQRLANALRAPLGQILVVRIAAARIRVAVDRDADPWIGAQIAGQRTQPLDRHRPQHVAVGGEEQVLLHGHARALRRLAEIIGAHRRAVPAAGALGPGIPAVLAPGEAAPRLPVEPVAASAGNFGEGAVGRRGLAPVHQPVAVEVEIAHHEGAAAIGAAQLGEELRHARPDEPVFAVAVPATIPVPSILCRCPTP